MQRMHSSHLDCSSKQAPRDKGLLWTRHRSSDLVREVRFYAAASCHRSCASQSGLTGPGQQVWYRASTLTRPASHYSTATRQHEQAF